MFPKGRVGASRDGQGKGTEYNRYSAAWSGIERSSVLWAQGKKMKAPAWCKDTTEVSLVVYHVP